MPQAKRSTKGSRKFARKNLVFSKTLAALPATRSPGLPTNTVMCQERMMPLSSSACQSGSQPGSSSLGLTLAIMRFTWHTPPLALTRSSSASAPSGVSGSIGRPIHVVIAGDEPVSHVVLPSVSSAELAVVPADYLLRDDLEHDPLRRAGLRARLDRRRTRLRRYPPLERLPDAGFVLEDLAAPADHHAPQFGVLVAGLDHQRHPGIAADVDD